MLKHFTLVAALFAALSAPTFGASTPILGAQFSPENLLTDPGFENKGAGWVASGGATKTANATAKGKGSAGYDWDSNSAGQTLLSSVTIPSSLYGKNGLAYCEIKVPSGTATHTITVDDGTTNLITPAAVLGNSTQFVRQTVNFIFPTSGSVRLKLTSVASNEPEIYIDNCFLGSADGLNVGMIQPNTTTVTYTPTISGLGSGTSTNTGRWSQVGDRMILTFAIWKNDAVAGTGSSVVTFSLPSGYTIDTTKNDSVDNGYGMVNTFGVSAASTYTPMAAVYASTTSIQFAKTSSGAFVTGADMRVNAYIAGVISLPITQFGGAVQAYRADTNSFVWEGYHDNTCDFTTTSANFALMTGDATCGFTQVLNENAGTVNSQTNGGNNTAGLSWTPNSSGKYEVCATFSGYNTTSGASLGAALHDSVDGYGPSVSLRDSTTGDYYFPAKLCKIVTATSPTLRTTEIWGAVGANTGHISSLAFTNAYAVYWTIKKLTQSIPAPVLVGTLSSNTASQERIERARIVNSAGAGTVSLQSGSWVTRNASATGDVTLDIAAGIFSGAPSCVCSVENDNTATVCISATIPTSTQLRFRTYRGTTGTDTLVNKDFDIICMGPR